MNYLKLVRYKNLLMLAVMQLILRFGFLKTQNIALALNDWQYALLVVATVAIAAGGYIINDIFDQETDSINKPENVLVGKSVSEAVAYNLYAVLNVIGVGIGFYLSNFIDKPMLSSFFIVISITLYLYASSFKQSLLIGNLIVSLLTAAGILIVGLFDLMPMVSPENQPVLATFFGILLDYAIFAFIINFIREVVKDLEDIKGDTQIGMNTLAITLGVAKTSKLLLVLSLVPIAALIYYTNKYYLNNQLYITVFYFMAFIIAPLIYFAVNIASAKTQKDFAHLSAILKIVMLMGVLSILVVTLNIKYNA